MTDRRRSRGRWIVGLALLAGALGAGAAIASVFLGTSQPPPALALPPEALEATAAEVHTFCGACHTVPPPDSFPRREWRRQVKQAYSFYRETNVPREFPSLEGVVRYYEGRAPEEWPPLPPATISADPPARWQRHDFRLPGPEAPPAVTNVTLARLSDARRPDVVVCDARRNAVLALKPYADPPAWRVLGPAAAPAHAEVVDLDGDGIPDVLVACLGEFYPTDAHVGSVVWLRGRADGTFTPIPLLEGVGRVADVQAADFNGDGKLDLVVAVFGWQRTGEVLYLENRTESWDKPTFVPHVVDGRHGAIHVPVADLDGDGRPDFVALISQEHEEVVAYLNEGGGRFRKQTLYAAPHPAWGSSGIQLADLDGDGKPDVLYTNGDLMDPPHLPRPDHAVWWLRNETADWKKPVFAPHKLAALPGVERAVAADLDGDGKLDVVAVTFVPPEKVAGRDERQFASVVVLEQVRPGEFVPHCLETTTCDHFTCAAGDVYGDRRAHLVTGNFSMNRAGPMRDAVRVWQNLGPRAGKPAAR
jgi:hypothetical protein